jgi:general secretion pathway protein A
MYESYWQFSRMPFETGTDADVYYPCETHQGALLKLQYAIENRREAALLAGPAGVGKTLLVRLLMQQLSESFAPRVHVVFPRLSTSDLLAWLASELTGVEGGPSQPDHVSVRNVEKSLSANAAAGKHAVIFLDYAHDLAVSGAFETIRLLMNFGSSGDPAVTFVLLGQLSLLAAIDRFPGLEERMAVKCLLRPLTLEETISYVTHRLTAAGATRGIFQESALEAIYHLTGGVPRKINRLCDLSLLIGFAEELPHIAAATVESVCDELVTVTPE